MTRAAASVYEQIEEYLDRSPAFAGGAGRVMSDLVKQAVSAQARERARDTQKQIHRLVQNLDQAKDDILGLVRTAKAEHAAVLSENLALVIRISAPQCHCTDRV
jgi:hypothetical protein